MDGTYSTHVERKTITICKVLIDKAVRWRPHKRIRHRPGWEYNIKTEFKKYVKI